MVKAIQSQIQRVIIALLISISLLQIEPTAFFAHAAGEAVITFRVSPNGNDATSCGTEAAPCKTIQYAINQTKPGDTFTILVSAGTYAYASATDSCTFLVTRAVVCFVDKHITILAAGI